jgi:hypothetical protein
VAAVFTQMGGDAVGPGFNRHQCCAHRIRRAATARCEGLQRDRH